MSKLRRNLYDCFVDSRGSRRFDFKLANSWCRLLQIVLGRAADFDNLPDILVMNVGARVKHNARLPPAASETAGFDETVAGESK